MPPTANKSIILYAWIKWPGFVAFSCDGELRYSRFILNKENGSVARNATIHSSNCVGMRPCHSVHWPKTSAPSQPRQPLAFVGVCSSLLCTDLQWKSLNSILLLIYPCFLQMDSTDCTVFVSKYSKNLVNSKFKGSKTNFLNYNLFYLN
jgi:hypothetical protein